MVCRHKHWCPPLRLESATIHRRYVTLLISDSSDMPGIKFLPVPGKPNIAWVFKGENYGTIEWFPEPKPSEVRQQSKPISKDWPSLVRAGFKSIDAAIHMGDDTVFFSGDRLAVVHIDREHCIDTLKDGPHPLSSWNSLKEIGFTSVDALLAVPDCPNQYFVFSGHECARLSLSPDKVIYGRGFILHRWATLPFITVGTTLPHPTDSSDAYFFTGSSYVRVTTELGSDRGKVHHDPYNTPHHWPSLVALGFFDSRNVLLSAKFNDPFNKIVASWDSSKTPNEVPKSPYRSLHLYTVWRTASGGCVEGRVLNLHECLGVKDGRFHWGGKDFHKHVRAITISGNVSETDGVVPRISLWARLGRTAASIDLTGMLELQANHNVVAMIPVEIGVRKQHLEEVCKKLDEHLENNAEDLKIVKVSSNGSEAEKSSDRSEPETFYVYSHAGPKDDGAIIKTHTAEAKAAVLHIADRHFKGDLLSVEADAQAGPTGVFAGAGAYIAKSEYGPLEVDGGLAVEVGAGFKDDSVHVEAGIFDITVGRKMGFHVFGAGLVVDWGKVFP